MFEMMLGKLKVIVLLISVGLSVSAIGQKLEGKKKDIDHILANIDQFSTSVMNSNYQAIGAAYTEDAKIFPNNKEIIQGREAIIKYWTLPAGVSTKYHKVKPEEIKITGKEAFDYGYYEGTTLKKDGTEVNWKGKYVIIWRKTREGWKIYLDIWNRIKD